MHRSKRWDCFVDCSEKIRQNDPKTGIWSQVQGLQNSKHRGELWCEVPHQTWHAESKTSWVYSSFIMPFSLSLILKLNCKNTVWTRNFSWFNLQNVHSQNRFVNFCFWQISFDRSESESNFLCFFITESFLN